MRSTALFPLIPNIELEIHTKNLSQDLRLFFFKICDNEME